MGESRGRPLPKFGEWDVNNPKTAEGFTMIFNKARNDKKTRATKVVAPSSDPKLQSVDQPSPSPKNNKWLCCVRV